MSENKRVVRLANEMQKMGVDVAVFIDEEEARSASIRYLTGHPSDAILIVGRDAHTVLIPWDVNMAKRRAVADEVIPYTDFQCKKIDALEKILGEGANALGVNGKGRNLKVELPPSTTHTDYLKFFDALRDYLVIVREDGVHAAVCMMRMIKDESEIECTKKACEIGDIIIDDIENGVRSHSIRTEIDVALLIERKLREKGLERTGFDTLAAGPERSFAIHAFPGYTAGKWPDKGLSILDFGVVYEGYTSDTTITVASGALSDRQKEMIKAVQKASDECLKMYRPKTAIKDAAMKADEIFSEIGMKMPHSLGHAIGLNIHETPRVSCNTPLKGKGDKEGGEEEDVGDGMFHEGMILTLEPGLYDAQCGGVRLENDILITKDEPVVLTHSRIIYI